MCYHDSLLLVGDPHLMERKRVKKIEYLGEKGQKKKAFLENTPRFFEAWRAARSPRCK